MEKELVKFLQDVNDSNHFWLVTGERLKNLEELACALEKMPEDVFSYHANENRNDFCSWIRECIGDIALATALLSIPTKVNAAKKINERIKEIKNNKKVKLDDRKDTVINKKSVAKPVSKAGVNSKKNKTK